MCVKFKIWDSMKERNSLIFIQIKKKEREKAFDQFIKDQPDQNPTSFLLTALLTNCKTERNLEEEEEAENKFREEINHHKRKVEEKARKSEIVFYPSLLFKSFVKTNANGVDILKPALSFQITKIC